MPESREIRELERKPREKGPTPLAHELDELDRLIMELEGSTEDSEHTEVFEIEESQEAQERADPSDVLRELLNETKRERPELAAMVDKITDNDQRFEKLLEFWELFEARGQKQHFMEVLQTGGKRRPRENEEHGFSEGRAVVTVP